MTTATMGGASRPTVTKLLFLLNVGCVLISFIERVPNPFQEVLLNFLK